MNKQLNIGSAALQCIYESVELGLPRATIHHRHCNDLPPESPANV